MSVNRRTLLPTAAASQAIAAADTGDEATSGVELPTDLTTDAPNQTAAIHTRHRTSTSFGSGGRQTRLPVPPAPPQTHPTPPLAKDMEDLSRRTSKLLRHRPAWGCDFRVDGSALFTEVANHIGVLPGLLWNLANKPHVSHRPSRWEVKKIEGQWRIRATYKHSFHGFHRDLLRSPLQPGAPTVPNINPKTQRNWASHQRHKWRRGERAKTEPKEEDDTASPADTVLDEPSGDRDEAWAEAAGTTPPSEERGVPHTPAGSAYTPLSPFSPPISSSLGGHQHSAVAPLCDAFGSKCSAHHVAVFLWAGADVMLRPIRVGMVSIALWMMTLFHLVQVDSDKIPPCAQSACVVAPWLDCIGVMLRPIRVGIAPLLWVMSLFHLIQVDLDTALPPRDGNHSMYSCVDSTFGTVTGLGQVFRLDTAEQIRAALNSVRIGEASHPGPPIASAQPSPPPDPDEVELPMCDQGYRRTIGGRCRRWGLSVQPSRKKTASCYNCATAFRQGDHRFFPWGDRAAASRFVHRTCIVGGWHENFELNPVTAEDTTAVAMTLGSFRAENESAALPGLQNPHPGVHIGDVPEPPPVGHGSLDLMWFDTLSWATIFTLPGTTYVQVPPNHAAAVAAIQFQLLCAITCVTNTTSAWKCLLMSSWLLLGRSAMQADRDRSAAERLEERMLLFRMGQFAELYDSVMADTSVIPPPTAPNEPTETDAVKRKRAKRVATLACAG